MSDLKALRRALLALSAGLLLAGTVIQAAPAQEADPMVLTREADQAAAGKRKADAISLYNRALGRYHSHPLRSWWVHQLAVLQAAPSVLESGDPLLPHYHWWRAMSTAKNFCNDGFAQYGRLSPLSEVLPSIAESTEIEARLGCAEKLPEPQRLALARVLDQHRYFWLMPRLLKTVAVQA